MMNLFIDAKIFTEHSKLTFDKNTIERILDVILEFNRYFNLHLIVDIKDLFGTLSKQETLLFWDIVKDKRMESIIQFLSRKARLYFNSFYRLDNNKDYYKIDDNSLAITAPGLVFDKDFLNILWLNSDLESDIIQVETDPLELFEECAERLAWWNKECKTQRFYFNEMVAFIEKMPTHVFAIGGSFGTILDLNCNYYSVDKNEVADFRRTHGDLDLVVFNKNHFNELVYVLTLDGYKVIKDNAYMVPEDEIIHTILYKNGMKVCIFFNKEETKVKTALLQRPGSEKVILVQYQDIDATIAGKTRIIFDTKDERTKIKHTNDIESLLNIINNSKNKAPF